MGYLLLMDFKELLQRWIYVLLSAVYRSQDEQRNKTTYARSFSKPGAFKWVIPGVLPFYSGCNLQWCYENSQILPWTSTIPMRKNDRCWLLYKYRRLSIFMRGKEKSQDSTEIPQKHLVQTPWKGHWLHGQSCQDLLKRDQQSCHLPY